ncbi:hypothetical protein WL71_30985 [Burkholderia ubonensis]|uniref:Uncharacterized protein n=1 Tax=Burkholderia ubonensis TaxID=101571 RepID=A0A107EJB9_9BURK|nr:hypothetical protein WL71_30985 [Burkholderia ubonensis]KWD89450.1 hypothetical protein WL72_33480 [Burkholderia ubonensis]KWD89466.1 hypothetical protein WL70_05745 [Burkholderia ubonensis]KWD96867.1 hypothetical protein WL73_21800 [Burkholderia ubonensis]
MALLRQHIAEAFRQFERGDAMASPPQGGAGAEAAHAAHPGNPSGSHTALAGAQASVANSGAQKASRS